MPVPSENQQEERKREEEDIETMYGTMVERVPLYISDNLTNLKRLVKDDAVKGLKRLDRLPGIAHRMFAEFLSTQNDQERAYIIARRYLKVMDHLFRLSANRDILEICYGGEYRKVKSLIVDLEADLESRYEDMDRRKLNDERINQPGQPQLYGKELFFRKFPIFDNLFISSTDLYNAVRNKWNILIVDIRRSNDFKESRISIDDKHLVNIPADILAPGLSANTLAQRLEDHTREIWEKRDTFEVIVLQDWNTDHFNFHGSKLERLRACIVEWDFNRKYAHEPVILDGGFKEFLERYPSEVTNNHVFLSSTNSEVDDILVIDDVSYPEVGLSDRDRTFKGVDRSTLRSGRPEGEGGRCESEDSEIRETIACDGNIEGEEIEELDEDAGVMGEGARVGNKAPALDRSSKPVQWVLADGYTGIINMRNNCYMSCMLQCLKSLPHFKSLFVTSNGYHKHVSKEHPEIVVQFAAVMRRLWGGTADRPESFYPETFFERVYEINPLYQKGSHEDTFEFFIFLFNLISDDCSFELPRLRTMTEREKTLYVQLQGRSSPFVELFFYQLRNDRICWHCRKSSEVFDSDSTIMLPVADVEDEEEEEEQQRQSLESMLAEYLKESFVPECSCSECKYSSTIFNRKMIIMDPEILVVVLKRYAADEYGTFRKIESDVSFPVRDFGFGKSRYRLYAVAHHIGSMSVGHYYASVLVDDVKGEWVKCNDEQVTRYRCPIDEVPNIESSCVGFFYVRQ